MVLTGDGRLWVAQAQLSAIAEIDTSGKVTQHPLPGRSGYPPHPYDLQASPDGGIWYSAGDQLGCLDPSGKFTWWDDGPTTHGNGPGSGSGDGRGYPDGVTLGPDDTVWYAHSVRGTPAFGRADKKRGLSGIAVLKGEFSILAGSITAGPDRAVWFSQFYQGGDKSGSDGIGRLTTEGSYKEWPLPKGTNPQRIVASPRQGAVVHRAGRHRAHQHRRRRLPLRRPGVQAPGRYRPRPRQGPLVRHGQQGRPRSRPGGRCRVCGVGGRDGEVTGRRRAEDSGK
ncbi:hypothetical protein GCM10020000_79220 [Streptomyces olivoverticillatus]